MILGGDDREVVSLFFVGADSVSQWATYAKSISFRRQTGRMYAFDSRMSSSISYRYDS